jgi:hypothetical protein
MDKEIFVYKYDTSAYDHIAAPYDLRTVPTVPSINEPWYRTATVTILHDDPYSADYTADQMKRMIEDLVTVYTEFADAFEGTDTTIYTG